MKIVFYIDQLLNGGAERVTAILASEFSNKPNCTIYVVALNEGILYQLNEKVQYVLIKQTQLRKPWKTFFRLYHSIIEIRKINPDVIYSLGYMGQYVLMARLLKMIDTRIIVSERTNPYIVPSKKINVFVRNYLYGKSDVIVSQTPQAEEYYKKRVRTRTCVIPNPIIPNLPLWRGQNSKDIVCACRLAEQKNIPMLIRAFKQVHKIYPEFKLRIYGQGKLKEDLQSLIEYQGLSDSITLEGQTSHLHDILANSYMSVLSSDYEGISNTMIESLGIGIPTLCTDCPMGGAAMFIKDGVNGLLSTVGDVDEFAKKMIYLIEHRDKLEEMSENARKITKILEQGVIAQRWYELAL